MTLQHRERIAPPTISRLPCAALLLAAALAQASPPAQGGRPAAASLLGQPGGAVLRVAQTGEPKTLNPLLAADQQTRDVIYAMSADLVHINRATQRTEPALAKSWSRTPDGRHYTLVLRDGLRFSDGTSLTADDVVFSFRLYLDPAVNSPQRDLLLLQDQPISVVKVSANTVRVDLPAAYGPGERLFDFFWIVPRHKLEKAYAEGRIAQMWGLGASPADFAAAGPFRLKQYLPGQRLILERNPYYWKKDEAGKPLPYLDRLELVFAADQNAQLLRLMAGEVDAAGKLRAEDFARLRAMPELQARDAGPGLEYNFVFFNWNAPEPHSAWFRNLSFRQAVAHAIDREAIVRLVYQGYGSPLWSQVTEGNRLWRAAKLAAYPRDPARAEQLLRQAGFRRDASGGALRDGGGRPVEFTVLVSASNLLRRKMATLIQDDLQRLGIRAQATPIEFGAMMDAVLNTRKFDAALWGMASGDADPNSEMNVWASTGSLHVWNLKKGGGADPRLPLEAWETEIDRLMQEQMTATRTEARKAAYDRVQFLLSERLPVVFLAGPHVLAAARRGLGNFQPAIIEPVLLWNCDRLFWQTRRP
jgi:peptide/nickel transport system substrate-binding protein